MQAHWLANVCDQAPGATTAGRYCVPWQIELHFIAAENGGSSASQLPSFVSYFLSLIHTLDKHLARFF